MKLKNEYGFEEVLKDLRFDETIIIFGFNQGEYIEEPNESEYIKYKDTIKNNLIKLIYTKDKYIEDIVLNIITIKNFLNMNIQIYGDYDVVYKEEYEYFISLIDKAYYNCTVRAVTGNSFKSISLKNLILNIKSLNDSYNFKSYMNINENIPAIIVSAGPSLDSNIKSMIKNKENLDKFIIIAGNRTVEPLLNAGIKPDLVTSIDPQDMMKNSINEKIPFVFFEKSNYKLVKEYKGTKIALSQGLFRHINELQDTPICRSGGSVAHVATDIAYLLGCNPIIFVGQDFGYKNYNSHAQIAKHEIDNPIDIEECIIIKDVYGNEMYTSEILNFYKTNLENFIKEYKDENKDINFYNSSYGANIEGATHKNIDDILKMNFTIDKVNITEIGDKLSIDSNLIINNLSEYMEETLNNIKLSKQICNDIIENPSNENIIKFNKVLNTIDKFVKDERSIYIGDYVDTFLAYIKEKLFKMKAKDYNVLSGDIIYQSNIFREYMNELELYINEIKNIIKACEEEH